MHASDLAFEAPFINMFVFLADEDQEKTAQNVKFDDKSTFPLHIKVNHVQCTSGEHMKIFLISW